MQEEDCCVSICTSVVKQVNCVSICTSVLAKQVNWVIDCCFHVLEPLQCVCVQLEEEASLASVFVLLYW